MWTPKDVVRQPLYVILPITNPIRYKRRWKLLGDAQKHIRDSGAIPIIVEAAFGEREYALEDHGPPAPLEHPGEFKSFGPANVPPSARMPQSRAHQDYIKLRTDDSQEIWLKENIMNIAVQHLPEDARYVAFVDADIQFTRPDWVSETLHQLQHYDVVQMWSTAINLSPDHLPMEANLGFAYCHHHGYAKSTLGTHYLAGTKGHPNAWHTGFGWAWRRGTLDQMGGLLEHGILGAGDNHMARALVGREEESINGKLSPGYKRLVRQWAARAREHIKGNIGYVEGTIMHHWHGQIRNRRYGDRWKILIHHQFDPDFDLLKDSRGVIKLAGNKPGLRDDIRRYLRSRHEDSIDAPSGDYRLVGARPDWTPTR